MEVGYSYLIRRNLQTTYLITGSVILDHLIKLLSFRFSIIKITIFSFISFHVLLFVAESLSSANSQGKKGRLSSPPQRWNYLLMYIYFILWVIIQNQIVLLLKFFRFGHVCYCIQLILESKRILRKSCQKQYL